MGTPGHHDRASATMAYFGWLRPIARIEIDENRVVLRAVVRTVELRPIDLLRIMADADGTPLIVTPRRKCRLLLLGESLQDFLACVRSLYPDTKISGLRGM